MSYQAVLDALGDPTRRLLVERLQRRPQSVGELARDLPISRPAVSQHLRRLKDAGLVRSTTAGTRNVYALETAGVHALREYAEALWDDVLVSFAELARREEELRAR